MAKRENYSDIYLEDSLPVLSAVIMEEYERQPDYIPEVFNVIDLNTWGDQTTTYAGVEVAAEKPEGESVAFSDALQGYDKTFKAATYAIATSVSEELIEDNRMNLYSEILKSLGMSMFQVRQIVPFNVINNGFTDTGPDGVSLFNTAHPLIGGGTYANRPSTDIALSVGGMRRAEIDMMRQVNHRSINVNIMPETILCPPELSQTAVELLKSPDRPDTANRAMNTFFQHRYKLIVTPYLTSATAWFCLAPKSSHKLRFYDRVAPTVKTWEDEKTGDINNRIRSRFVAGYSDFIGVWGSNPS